MIEAVQWTGLNQAEVFKFCKDLVSQNTDGDWAISVKGRSITDPGKNRIYIKTLEGMHEAKPGDYIIKGVAGKFYPCKPDIFEKTYELAE